MRVNARKRAITATNNRGLLDAASAWKQAAPACYQKESGKFGAPPRVHTVSFIARTRKIILERFTYSRIWNEISPCIRDSRHDSDFFLAALVRLIARLTLSTTRMLTGGKDRRYNNRRSFLQQRGTVKQPAAQLETERGPSFRLLSFSTTGGKRSVALRMSHEIKRLVPLPSALYRFFKATYRL